jgi:hypothetical protein
MPGGRGGAAGARADEAGADEAGADEAGADEAGADGARPTEPGEDRAGLAAAAVRSGRAKRVGVSG